MKGMILAAGFGTRFRPVTFTVPKPLVPICNRPLIAYAADAMLDAGVDHLIINLHHLPIAIEAFLRARYGHRSALSFSIEEQILGTGGGIRRARALLEGEEDFLLANGDTIQRAPFGDLLSARSAHDAIAALTLRHPPAGDRFTRVWYDGGRITGIGDGTGQPLMFSGSHAVSQRIFDYLPDRDFSGVTEDVYIPLLRSGEERLAAVIDDGIWFDIGTPLRYVSASAAILQLTLQGHFQIADGSVADIASQSIIAADATIAGSVTRSSIGQGTSVERGASVVDSSVWDGCRVAEDVVLERCIVGHGVTIPRGIHLTNALIAADDEAIPPEFERLGGIVIAPVDPAVPITHARP